tara:strand:+ start:463 stop:1575 length:1113 start_codon:yes stop_codon:yes gene_type:complete
MIIIFCGFLFRIALITYNSGVGILPGGNADALTYHFLAVSYDLYLQELGLFPATTWVHRFGWIYTYALGYIFHFTGIKSFYFSGFLSCFAWFLSAIFFRKIMLKLKFEKKNINLATVIYCFVFPTSIIYTSLTLREPYMLLFFNLCALLIVNIYYEKEIKKILLNIIFILLTFYIIAIFHIANLYFVIALFSLIIIYYFINKFNIGKYTSAVLIILIVFFLSYFGYTEIMFDSIKKYQLGHFYTVIDRASYYTRGEVENLNYDLISFFIYFSKNTFNYLVQPTIFNLYNVKDFLLFCENIVRLILVYFILKKTLLQFNSKKLFIIFLTMFMVMEIMYAQVTINWGTASRHHVPIMGIFILLAFFPIRKAK